MKEKVLIVDDTEFYQKAYKNKLLSAGYITSVANNGVEALKALTTDKPDLILLDLMMPIMDGFKVLQTVKANPNLQKYPDDRFFRQGCQRRDQQSASSRGKRFSGQSDHHSQ
ncbi:MAG: response regulator [Candidatus Manganitrophus sp.]|nr:response regulator [Candidatus Manganitrophus sp.]